jgi:transposase
MNNSVIGLDIAKHIFHLFTLGVDGKATKKKLKRNELLAFFANYPVSIIGIEACGSAHHWARELTKLGHEVILLNARYVKSFVVGNKNDFNDAAAIYDAVTRPNKRVVAIKTVAQQDIQLVHSMRKELVDKRTALVNQTKPRTLNDCKCYFFIVFVGLRKDATQPTTPDYPTQQSNNTLVPLSLFMPPHYQEIITGVRVKLN